MTPWLCRNVTINSMANIEPIYVIFAQLSRFQSQTKRWCLTKSVVNMENGVKWTAANVANKRPNANIPYTKLSLLEHVGGQGGNEGDL